jgi:hypothetical protein
LRFCNLDFALLSKPARPALHLITENPQQEHPNQDKIIVITAGHDQHVFAAIKVMKTLGADC